MRSFIFLRNSLNSSKRLPTGVSSKQGADRLRQARCREKCGGGGTRRLQDGAAECGLDQPDRELAGLVLDVQRGVELHHFHADELAALRDALADEVRLAEIEPAGNGRTRAGCDRRIRAVEVAGKMNAAGGAADAFQPLLA